MKKPELLLPVGNMTMCLAAIHNGADAVYLGSPYFNARGRSKDHSIEELKEMIDLCHLYGVQVHIAFNILIFQDELESAFNALKELISLGADALIIQDFALVQMVRMISPNQVIHGSTQMSITNYESINFLNDLDIDRFVLGRENTLSDIKTIKENTNKEIEVFVHGALCVAYSGQCFTSESLGGRSANRGQCAQSCRFEYDLIVDGETKDLDGKKYLVSPKDLCGIDEIPSLAKLGVESLKVEGRLKSKEFVAVAARSYRQAIDKSLKNTYELKKQMSSTFSRGFYSGWLNGAAHQELVSGDYQDHRGLEIGEVVKVKSDRFILKSDTIIKNGDGLLFTDSKKQIGSKIVYSKSLSLDEYEVKLLDRVDIKLGQKVYLNSDDSLNKEVAKSIKDESLLKRIGIKIKVNARLGECLEVSFSDGINKVSASLDTKIEKAKNRPTSKESIEAEILKLSRCVYKCNKIDVIVDDNVFINLKDIKNIKNKLIGDLNNLRIKNRNIILDKPSYQVEESTPRVSNKKLNLLIRNFSQLESLLELFECYPQYKNKLNHLILDYEFGKDFVKSVKLAKEDGIRVYIATTRILKPNEYHNFKLIKRAAPDGILVRNLGALEYFKDDEFDLVGDFSLNITNSLSFNYLAHKSLKSICLSYDLNQDQLSSLLKNIDTSKAEVTIYQYMPEFHMEHCVFAAFMSKGNSFRDCGKPCEKHEVALKDMYGNMHEIKADQECRNTMFNGVAQSAIGLIEDWQSKGVSNFRLEVLHETGEVFKNKIKNILSFFSDEISKNDVIISLSSLEKYGVSSGQLLNKDNYRDVKIHD